MKSKEVVLIKDINALNTGLSFFRDLLLTIAFPAVCIWIMNGFPDYFTLSSDGFRTPIAHTYLATILFLSAVSIFCYWMSKLYYSEFPPLLRVITSVGILQGIYLGIIMTIQVLPVMISVIIFSFSKFPLSLILLVLILIPLTPTLIVYLFVSQLIRVHKSVMKETGKRKRRFSESTLAFILLLPWFAVEDVILILFHQRPDSAILAFTQTCNYLLSQHPCNISSAGHYLCTAASNGHAGLVRPVRYGMRGGGVILVNRQLLVANAFENWLEENAPVFHKIVRSNYDKYGIPLYRLINNVWISDLVYILMKPLELFFVVWLYLFDRNPEDRIASQYLPNSDWLKTESLLQ